MDRPDAGPKFGADGLNIPLRDGARCGGAFLHVLAVLCSRLLRWSALTEAIQVLHASAQPSDTCAGVLAKACITAQNSAQVVWLALTR